MRLLAEAQTINAEVIVHRRHIHQHPEICDELPNTTHYVIEQLEALGYEPKEICKSGIVATIGKKQGKTILIRADMDALPVKEETDLPFRATNGYMHACGHDLHTAMLLGVAKLLKTHEHELEGTVKLMFQPAEEILKGGKMMVEAGVLENPKVDAALATHVMSHSDPHPPNKLLVTVGVAAASSDIFRITVQGVGCHGAMPDTGVDPINVGCHIVLNLQTLNARENEPSEVLIITIGKFAGGNASNVIPDLVVLEGTIRTFNGTVRSMAKKRLEEIAVQTATLFRATAKVEFLYGAPPLVTDNEFIQEITQYVKKALPEEQVSYYDRPLTGSEDFAYIAEQVPAAFFMITAGTQLNPYPQHHPKVDFREDVMPTGIAAMTQAAIEWLKNNK